MMEMEEGGLKRPVDFELLDLLPTSGTAPGPPPMATRPCTRRRVVASRSPVCLGVAFGYTTLGVDFRGLKDRTTGGLR